ncbi:MAG: hypothetical protein ACYCTB_02645 [bacterium]
MGVIPAQQKKVSDLFSATADVLSMRKINRIPFSDKVIALYENKEFVIDEKIKTIYHLGSHHISNIF